MPATGASWAPTRNRGQSLVEACAGISYFHRISGQRPRLTSFCAQLGRALERDHRAHSSTLRICAQKSCAACFATLDYPAFFPQMLDWVVGRGRTAAYRKAPRRGRSCCWPRCCPIRCAMRWPAALKRAGSPTVRTAHRARCAKNRPPRRC